MSRYFEVECPECGGVLKVDSEKQVVISHEKKRDKPQSLEDFMESQKRRNEELDAKFREGVEKEKHKKEEIERKFQEAMKNKDKLPDPPKPGIQWD